jgi:hypothetical protein
LPPGFGPLNGTEALFYGRWLAAQPGYDGAPSTCAVQNDGKPHQVRAPGGTGIIVSSVAVRNNSGNSGSLAIYSGSSSGAPLMTLAAGQDRSLFWVDPGSLWYVVTGGASTDVYEISWGA